MIEFKGDRLPAKALTIISAYVSDEAILAQGKKFLHEVLAKLVRESVIIHRIEIDNMVTEYILSDEIREYIKNKVRDTLDKAIQQEVEHIFLKGK